MDETALKRHTVVKDPVEVVPTTEVVSVVPVVAVVSGLLVGRGKNVRVAPSVVKVTGVVIPVGDVMVLVPIIKMTTPEEVEVMVSVLGDVIGSGPNVKVAPSVVIVTGVVTWVGAMIVSVPMMTTTTPDEVDVIGSSGIVVGDVGSGSNVRVTP